MSPLGLPSLFAIGRVARTGFAYAAVVIVRVLFSCHLGHSHQWLLTGLDKVIANRPYVFNFFLNDSLKLDNLVLVKDSCYYFKNSFSGVSGVGSWYEL